MENSKRNLEIIDQFIDNERKSRIWTTVNIAIFCLLGLAVFWLAFELNKSNVKYRDTYKELEVKNEELTKTQAKLDTILLQVNAKKDSLQVDSAGLSKSLGYSINNYDSLRKAYDTVMLIFNEVLAKQSGSNQPVDERLNQYAKAVFNKDVQLSDNIISKVVTPVKVGNPTYKVYVQYMPGYEKIADMATTALKKGKFEVPGQEQIKTVSFNSVVRYFYDRDKNKAEEVAGAINRTVDYFMEKPVTVQKVDLKSPAGQIEVWIGEYKKLNVEQIIIQQEQRQPIKMQQAKMLKKGS